MSAAGAILGREGPARTTSRLLIPLVGGLHPARAEGEYASDRAAWTGGHRPLVGNKQTTPNGHGVELAAQRTLCRCEVVLRAVRTW